MCHISFVFTYSKLGYRPNFVFIEIYRGEWMRVRENDRDNEGERARDAYTNMFGSVNFFLLSSYFI